jgi:murein tripeptide amidase MpaA
MYLNIAETLTKLEILQTQYPQYCQVITLPEQTEENRDVWALRVKTSSAQAKHGILIIAGLHAREWGNTDIVIFCMPGNGVTRISSFFLSKRF